MILEVKEMEKFKKKIETIGKFMEDHFVIEIVNVVSLVLTSIAFGILIAALINKC